VDHCLRVCTQPHTPGFVEGKVLATHSGTLSLIYTLKRQYGELLFLSDSDFDSKSTISKTPVRKPSQQVSGEDVPVGPADLSVELERLRESPAQQSAVCECEQAHDDNQRCLCRPMTAHHTPRGH
jgi:hypothetical protein